GRAFAELGQFWSVVTESELMHLSSTIREDAMGVSSLGTCGGCRRPLTPEEPVWRQPHGWGTWGYCRACTPTAAQPDLWYPSRACQSCGRRVYDARRSRAGRPQPPHRWAACCEFCENRARARQRAMSTTRPLLAIALLALRLGLSGATVQAPDLPPSVQTHCATAEPRPPALNRPWQ